MFYSFGAVPFSLFVFGLEMHYSTCPWVDDFYIQSVANNDMSAQCAINGWALAGVELVPVEERESIFRSSPSSRVVSSSPRD